MSPMCLRGSKNSRVSNYLIKMEATKLWQGYDFLAKKQPWPHAFFPSASRIVWCTPIHSKYRIPHFRASSVHSCLVIRWVSIISLISLSLALVIFHLPLFSVFCLSIIYYLSSVFYQLSLHLCICLFIYVSMFHLSAYLSSIYHPFFFCVSINYLSIYVYAYLSSICLTIFLSIIYLRIYRLIHPSTPIRLYLMGTASCSAHGQAWLCSRGLQATFKAKADDSNHNE